jgi:hypothetical protein
MNNDTALEICAHNLTYDKFLHISTTVWHVFGFIGIIIGIPGQILRIVVSSHKTSLKEPTTLYIIAIAICELVFLIGLYQFYVYLKSYIWKSVLLTGNGYVIENLQDRFGFFCCICHLLSSFKEKMSENRRIEMNRHRQEIQLSHDELFGLVDASKNISLRRKKIIENSNKNINTKFSYFNPS